MKQYLFLLVMMTGLSAPAQEGRALWVWEQDTRNALFDPSAATSVLDFAQSRNIDRLYLYSDSFLGTHDLIDNPGLYEALITGAHDRGIEVHALLGSEYLSTWEYVLPEKRPLALAMISNVLGYNDSASAAGRFDGFSIDIEPYLLPDWWASQPTYAEYYLDMLTEQKQLVDLSGQDLRFDAAIPRWYDTAPELQLSWNGTVLNLAAHVQNQTDSITIMDYRNDAFNLVNDASGELATADAIGKKVTVGVETLNVLPAFITFYGFTEEEMEAVLSTAEASFQTHPSYDGMAIHHYGSYQELVAVPEASSIWLLLGGLALCAGACRFSR